MVKRKISKERYIFAFLITLLIFFLGIMLGLVIENKRATYIKEKDAIQRLDFLSLQLQYQFVDFFSQENNCNALTKTFEENLKSLELTRIRLEDYQKDSSLKKQDFDLLVREYILAQVRYWLLATQTKEICDLEFSTILFFFGNERECDHCSDQSVVLSYLKHKMGMTLLNFAFDATFEKEPLTTILVKTYNITEYPSLVINGKRYSGLMKKDEILKVICPTYKKGNVSVCQPYQ